MQKALTAGGGAGETSDLTTITQNKAKLRIQIQPTNTDNRQFNGAAWKTSQSNTVAYNVKSKIVCL